MAITQRVVDGCIDPWHMVPPLRLNDLLKTHTEFSDLSLSSTTFVLVMNKDVYDRLPRDLKTVIDNNSGQFAAGIAGAMWDLQAAAAADMVGGTRRYHRHAVAGGGRALAQGDRAGDRNLAEGNEGAEGRRQQIVGVGARAVGEICEPAGTAAGAIPVARAGDRHRTAAALRKPKPTPRWRPNPLPPPRRLRPRPNRPRRRSRPASAANAIHAVHRRCSKPAPPPHSIGAGTATCTGAPHMATRAPQSAAPAKRRLRLPRRW